MVEIFAVLLRSGENIFSFLKPSRTESSINKVARVFQSIFSKSTIVGGVIKRETMAARRETESISSFLKSAIIFLNIKVILLSLHIKSKWGSILKENKFIYL